MFIPCTFGPQRAAWEQERKGLRAHGEELDDDEEFPEEEYEEPPEEEDGAGNPDEEPDEEELEDGA